MNPSQLLQFLPLYAEHPPRRPNSWQKREFRRLGMVEWPKEIGFFNAGDNFELTPEMMFRLFSRNHNEKFWNQSHNEKVVVHLMPLVEKDPKRGMERVDAVFQSHIQRFGADHAIFNVVMQAAAFAKDFERCAQMFREMKTLGLVPNAQTIVNMMFAVKLCGKDREKAVAYFNEGVRLKALNPVMRLDTEFQMWWDQFERLGSFTSTKGFLSVKEEGARPRPKDMFALWGWDKEERKFQSTRGVVKDEVRRRSLCGSRALLGTRYSTYTRQPWAKYKGLFPYDIKGPAVSRKALADPFADAPCAAFNNESCGPSY